MDRKTYACPNSFWTATTFAVFKVGTSGVTWAVMAMPCLRSERMLLDLTQELQMRCPNITLTPAATSHGELEQIVRNCAFASCPLKSSTMSHLQLSLSATLSLLSFSKFLLISFQPCGAIRTRCIRRAATL